MKRFSEKVQMYSSWNPKCSIYPILDILRIFVKKSYVTSLDLLNPNFMRKLKMGNEPALEGVLYRWTELN